MALAENLAEIFKNEFEKVLIKENSEEKFLPQEDFDSCEERAKAGIDIAIEPVIKTLALAICNHREACHNEDMTAESELLEKELTDEQIKIASEPGWF